MIVQYVPDLEQFALIKIMLLINIAKNVAPKLPTILRISDKTLDNTIIMLIGNRSISSDLFKVTMFIH